jgi:RNA polymerase sigma-70 factor (ECF subfamily)
MNPAVPPAEASGFPEERGLAARLRRRDPAALARLYDLHGLNAYRVALRIVRNESVAEDVVQETFERLWSRSDQIRENVTSLGPWILAIARNRALDYLRLSDVRASATGESIDAAFVCPTEEDNESLLLAKETVGQLQSAFLKLSERERKVIELAYYQGLSQSQIATLLDQPLGTVKGWARSALHCLRAAMAETRGE